MSGRVVLQAAIVARLNAVLDVSVFDAPPVRGGLPYAVVDEPVLSDWSTKTWVGREGRILLTLFDGGSGRFGCALCWRRRRRGWRRCRPILVRGGGW